jgi:integrase
MPWSAIDLDKRLISFTPKKTKRGKKVLRIPLHPELERQLLKHPGIGNAPLFPSLIGRGSGGAHGLSAEFAAIMRKAGVRGAIIRHTLKGRGNTTKSFHSLRHSFNSALANAGVTRELRQVLTGHASEKMNELYTHREVEPLRAAITALPNVCGK